MMNWPSKFFYSATNMMIILFMQPLIIPSLLELKEKDFSNSYSIMSYTFSIFVVLAMGIFYISVWLVNLRNLSKVKHPIVKKMFMSYISPLKNKWIAFSFWPVFVT